MLLKSIFETINHIADNDGGRIAFYEGDRAVTYFQFRGMIAGIATDLSRFSLRPGCRVGIFLENSIQAYAAVYATISLGCVYVPLGVDEPEERIKRMLEDAGLDLLIAARDTGLSNFAVQAYVFEEHGPVQERLSPVISSGGSALYILYTSGSTGVPKGVSVSHSNLENFILWAAKHFAADSSDVFLAHPRLTFDLSAFNLFLPFLVGASVRIAADVLEQLNPAPLLKQDVSIALLAPRITSFVVDSMRPGPLDFPKLRHLLFCGERLLASQVNAWRAENESLFVHNLYGPTETTVACSCFTIPPGEPVSDPISIGKPLPNIGFCIDGAANEGELVVSGRQVAPDGYLNFDSPNFFEDPTLGWCFRTGDMVRRDNAGFFYWISRVDDQIKIAGRRVEPGEIEAVFSVHPQVKDVACVFDAERTELSLLVCPMDSSERRRITEELIGFGMNRLPPYMRPQRFEFVESIPKTKNGKLDRDKIKQNIL